MNAQDYKKQLESEYKYKLELHAHSNPASGCSEVPAPDLVRTYAELGYHGIVLTNHFIYDYSTCMRGRSVEEGIAVWLNDYREAVEEGKKYGLAVFLGAEIRFTENDNDYLIYGLTEEMLSEIYRRLPAGVESFRKNYKMPDSVFLQAHPFRDGMVEVDPAILDGIETFNMHPGQRSRNAVANIYAKKKGIGIRLVASDFHFLRGRDVAVSAIRTKTMPKDAFEIAKILRSGDFIGEVGGQALILP